MCFFFLAPSPQLPWAYLLFALNDPLNFYRTMLRFPVEPFFRNVLPAKHGPSYVNLNQRSEKVSTKPVILPLTEGMSGTMPFQHFLQLMLLQVCDDEHFLGTASLSGDKLETAPDWDRDP